MAHGQAVELGLGQQVAADGFAHHPQRQQVFKAEVRQVGGISGGVRRHHGEIATVLGKGAQGALQQSGQQFVRRDAFVRRQAGEPDALAVGVMHRHSGQHQGGRRTGLFQQQDVFQPCHPLQPAGGVLGGITGGGAAQPGQCGKIFCGGNP